MSSSRPTAKRRLNPIERTDLAVAQAAAIDGRKVLARRVRAFAQLGDQPPLRILCGVTIAAGLLRRDPALARTGLRMLAAHGVATWVKGVIKHRIDRTRPGDAMKNGRYRLDPGESHARRLSSMPSGHSAGVAAVAMAAARDYPAAAPASGITAASIIAAQLPSKNHFLSDVVVGSAIGFTAEVAVSALMRKMRQL